MHNGWQTARVYMPDELKARIEKLVLDYNQQMAAGGGAMTGGGASSTPNGQHQASALTGAPAGTSDPLMHATQEQLLAAAGRGGGGGHQHAGLHPPLQSAMFMPASCQLPCPNSLCV